MNRLVPAVIAVAFSACAAPAYVAGLRKPLASHDGITIQEGRIEGSARVKLLWRSWKPEGPTKATLIVVHGLKDHGDRYAALAETMVREGFGVYALDLRGHGDSEGERVWIDSFEEYVDDLATFAADVRAKEQGKPLFVFGHSMGGAIVTLYVLTKKPEVRGVVLSAPALRRGEGVSGFLAALTGFFGTVTPSLAVLDLPNEQFSKDPQVVSEIGADPLVYQGAGPARTANELLNAIERIDADMEKFDAPLLALHGTEDKLTNPDGSMALVARAATKDKSLLVYPGAWHDLLHEPEKAKVLEDIRRWLVERAEVK